ncbi:hypothetical protein, partial [Metamycoplasma hominis]|uniref:hypothetical protein n=2 Tax=Metamycoplasma hominis TaxID=2098 RepID=UPI0015EEA4E6
DSQDGQKVDTSKANQSLQNNNVDASSTVDQIVNATNEIKKATQDLQKLIDAAKDKAKQDFNSKKQQLDDLIKSNEAKDVDNSQDGQKVDTSKANQSLQNNNADASS